MFDFRRSLSLCLVISFAFLASTTVHAGLIRTQLEANKTSDVPLPLKSLISVADKLEVKFHSDNTVAMASFSAGGFLQTNKLFLYEPYYKLTSGELIHPADMLIDVSSYYFSSLVEAYLVLNLEKSTNAYQQFYTARAKALMKDVPAQYQVEAYRNALTGFAGSLFSTTISIQRSYNRNPTNICAAFVRPQSIFTLWESYFKDGSPFPGEYYMNNNYVLSKFSLETVDKEAFVKEVLENYWTGDRVKDFQTRLCP